MVEINKPEKDAPQEKKFRKKVDLSKCSTIARGSKNPRSSSTTPTQIRIFGLTLSKIIFYIASKKPDVQVLLQLRAELRRCRVLLSLWNNAGGNGIPAVDWSGWAVLRSAVP